MWNNQTPTAAAGKNYPKKKSKLLDIYELFDISSSSEDEDVQERASTPLPRESISNYRIVLNTILSPTESVADEEEYFDISADSLDADCKRMLLNSTLESLESGELASNSPKSNYSTEKAQRAQMKMTADRTRECS